MSSPAQYGALREGAGFLDRSGRGRLRLGGEDRRAYLQGLLTNDIAALGPATGCYAALLTPQGRMIADMRVLELGDAILIDLEPEVATTVREHLDRFVFSEDVEVKDLTPSSVQLGVYGPAAAAVVARALATSTDSDEKAPTADRLGGMKTFESTRAAFAGHAVIVVRSDDIGASGFDLVAGINLRDDLARALLAAGAIEVSAETAEVTRVEAGRPRFLRDMTEDTIPLEAGIEDRAISLTKGCYVGQEIIIRVLHRGHGRVARRLVGLSLDASSPVPAPGDRLRSGDRDIGQITSAVRSPALDRPIALAYVHRDYVEPGTAVAVANEASWLLALVSELPFVSVSKPSIAGT